MARRLSFRTSGRLRARQPKARLEKHPLDYWATAFTALAAIGASAAAGAATYQAWIAKDTEHRQLRAYIEMVWRDFGNGTQFNPLEPLSFRFDVRNRGLTPALKVLAVGRFDIYPYPFPKTMKFDVNMAVGKESSIFPGSTGVEEIQFNAPRLSETDRQLITLPSMYAYVMFGTADYEDIFGIKHFTHFCSIYRLSRNGSPDIGRCNQHNEIE